MYPVLPIESLDGVVQCVSCVVTMLSALLGLMWIRQ